MSWRGLGVVVIGALVLATGAIVMPACVGDEAPIGAAVAGDSGPAQETTPGPAALGANGVQCADGKTCQSGLCIDGVCCAEKCDGVCEKCNMAGALGVCSAVPEGQDPDKECLPAPLPDAGAPPADAGGDGSTDGGDDAGDAGEPADAAPPAPSFDLPDGGYPTTNESACAGKCNGKRACAYPKNDTSCGPSFCGNTSTEARAVCDGAGHCTYETGTCTAYACPSKSAGCKTACAAPEDCLETHFCEGATGVCKPRLATGVSCTRGIECTTGYCIDGICCNTACDTSVAGGGSCSTPSKLGQCVCGACPGGTCQLYYRDADADGYGDVRGTTANGNAKFACAGSPPAGFVEDHTDCFDAVGPVGPKVHPNQAEWFTTAYTDADGQPSFDYNCSGGPDKETNDTFHCGVCYSYVFQPVSPVILPVCIAKYLGSCSSAGQQGVHGCSCYSDNNSAFFSSIVDCGKTGYTVQCGTCSSASGDPSLTNYQSKQQRCH
ncbi:MAG: hypothetical protein U0270_38315 [Labilithrix sp.]